MAWTFRSRSPPPPSRCGRRSPPDPASAPGSCPPRSRASASPSTTCAGGSSEAEVTDAEPPRRLRFTEDGGAQATEFLVEARSGGTCVVRVVGSGFGGKGADDGWTAALLGLKLYLEHFAGQEAANVLAGGRVPGPQARAWEELQATVGLGDPAEGTRVSASADGAPPLAGVVEGKLDTMVTLRLEEPAPGLAFVGVGGPDDETVFAILRRAVLRPRPPRSPSATSRCGAP